MENAKKRQKQNEQEPSVLSTKHSAVVEELTTRQLDEAEEKKSDGVDSCTSCHVVPKPPLQLLLCQADDCDQRVCMTCLEKPRKCSNEELEAIRPHQMQIYAEGMQIMGEHQEDVRVESSARMWDDSLCSGCDKRFCRAHILTYCVNPDHAAVLCLDCLTTSAKHGICTRHVIGPKYCTRCKQPGKDAPQDAPEDEPTTRHRLNTYPCRFCGHSICKACQHDWTIIISEMSYPGYACEECLKKTQSGADYVFFEDSGYSEGELEDYV